MSVFRRRSVSVQIHLLKHFSDSSIWSTLWGLQPVFRETVKERWCLAGMFYARLPQALRENFTNAG